MNQDDTEAPVPLDESTKSKIRHDLRTPINQIIGYSEMLREEAEADGQAGYVPDLEKIGVAARSLLAGIDNLLGAVEAPRQGLKETQNVAVTEEAGDEAAPSRQDIELSSGPARILVVDDNEMNRDMLSRRLQRRGYEVYTAEDGRVALDLIGKQSFDLLLLDIMMPGLSGYEVLEIVRKEHSASDLPIIMATAKGEGEDIVSAFNLGANDYVTKPIDFPVLLVRVATQLSLKKAVEDVKVLADKLERQKRFIRKTFGRYLSDEVVDSILDTPEGLKLGGEKRTVTVLMSDLRGFSSISERLHPEQVVTMLNNYLGAMAEIIAAYQGTIDEFIGDAILALFGAPVRREDDAERAIACATAMQRAMTDVNRKNRELGLPDLEMGIAINTGEVVVGNIGSQKRSKYGVVGSQVNLTGRIESYTVGGQILVSRSTVDASSATLELGEEMSLGAKGFKDPVVVYDLLGIGGSYDLYLDVREEDLKTLVREIPLKVCKLDGKHVSGEEFSGSMVRLSLQRGEMRSEEMRTKSNLEPMNNLRIRLTGLNGVLVPGDLYAKVLADNRDGYKLHFTSMPSEIKTFFRSALANETI